MDVALHGTTRTATDTSCLSRILIAAAMLIVSATAVWAQPSESAPRVARLVESLGSDSYQARRAADLQLLQIGNEGRRQLEAAARSDDPEIRLRALNLLERIAVTRLWEPTSVTLTAQKEPIADLLVQCGQQTGNHISVGEPHGEFHNILVTYSAEQKPYWEVLDDLSRMTGNRIRAHYDTRVPGLVFVAGEPGKQPTAYSGPIRAQITSARRSFVEDLDYEQPASEVANQFQINVQMVWEDRFRLVAYGSQPEVVEAKTNTGASVAASQSMFDGWNVASPGTRQVSASLKLNPPPIAATSLSVLRLKWSLIALGELAIAELQNPRSGAELHADGMTVNVVSLDRQTSGRVELTLLVTRSLALPDPPEILFQENVFELLDANNGPLRLQSQQHSLSDRGGEFKLAFLADSATSVPTKLRVAYPTLRSRRDVEITFRDVPLPSQQPE